MWDWLLQPGTWCVLHWLIFQGCSLIAVLILVRFAHLVPLPPVCKWRPINTLFTGKLLGLMIWSRQRHLRRLAERCTARSHSFSKALIASRTSLSPSVWMGLQQQFIFLVCCSSSSDTWKESWQHPWYSTWFLQPNLHSQGRECLANPTVMGFQSHVWLLSENRSYFPTSQLSWFQNNQPLLSLILQTLHSSILVRISGNSLSLPVFRGTMNSKHLVFLLESAENRMQQY